MGLFSSDRTLGVDVGTSKLKVVELKKAAGGKAELSTYGMAAIPPDVVRADSDTSNAQVSQALKAVLTKARIRAKRVYASLPGFSVFSQEIVLPGTGFAKNELNRIVKQEAGLHVQGDLSQMILDWEILEDILPPGAPNPTHEETKVLLTAAPRAVVERYDRIFRSAGLELVSLETESMALVRSLIGRDRLPAMIVDIGATATDIIVVESGMPRFTRTLDTGGLAMTQAIAKSLQVSFEQAEQFKKDVGLQSGQQTSQTNTGTPQGMTPIVDQILKEIGIVLARFKEQRGIPMERIVLAGGAAKLIGFDTLLSERLNIPAAIGNPFARVLHEPELDTLLTDVGPDLGVAIGLSMKGIY